MPYVAVTALSHSGLVRRHNEDSLAVGPWTLCGTETENPQTLLFALVTQTLGGSTAFTAVRPHVSTSSLVVGTRYLVCSDGLTDPVPGEEIEALLGKHQDGRAAFEMWKAAMEAGGPDNLTLALVRVA